MLPAEQRRSAKSIQWCRAVYSGAAHIQWCAQYTVVPRSIQWRHAVYSGAAQYTVVLCSPEPRAVYSTFCENCAMEAWLAASSEPSMRYFPRCSLSSLVGVKLLGSRGRYLNLQGEGDAKGRGGDATTGTHGRDEASRGRKGTTTTMMMKMMKMSKGKTRTRTAAMTMIMMMMMEMKMLKG
eukprot:1191348-Prorocentrum_minimum.AAC.2